ncbi:MAG: putative sugar O-methyltransferase [Burkholderiales bacterium]
MMKLQLPAPSAKRLAGFLQSEAGNTPRSGHWQHFSSLNHISVDAAAGTVTFRAGAGFDSEYELNFRKRTLAETLSRHWLGIRGLNPDSRFSGAFFKLLPDNPAIDARTATNLLHPPMTAHKFLAVHYANLLLPSLPAIGKTTYVEIGPGSGYLAALVHRHRPGRLILIDLPEILPYSFLLLHRTFPDSPFLLPNELEDGTVRLPQEGFVYMTADQASRLPDDCMDIGVNTASFGEMLPHLVDQYFTLLRRIVKPDGLFFTCNRVEKWMSGGNDPTGAGAKVPVRFDQYPWSPLDRDIFYGKSVFHDLVQPENPMLQRLCRLAPSPAAATSA